MMEARSYDLPVLVCRVEIGLAQHVVGGKCATGDSEDLQ